MDIQKLSKSIKDEFKSQMDRQLNVEIDMLCQEFRKRAIKAKNEYILSVMDSIEVAMREDKSSHDLVFTIRNKGV